MHTLVKNNGRRALVTGATSGIGLAIVHRLLADGWQVVGIGRRSSELKNASYQHIVCDLSDLDQVKKIAKDLVQPNAFVHAAGLMSGGRLGELDTDASLMMWKVHIGAAEIITNQLLPKMVQGDRIVLIGSRTATGSANRSQYSSTKSALSGLARSWAIETVALGVTVNIVAPAATDTPFLDRPERSGVPVKLPPIGRLIKAEEVADTVYFLLSDSAGAITGQTITICGGSSL